MPIEDQEFDNKKLTEEQINDLLYGVDIFASDSGIEESVNQGQESEPIFLVKNEGQGQTNDSTDDKWAKNTEFSLSYSTYSVVDIKKKEGSSNPKKIQDDLDSTIDLFSRITYFKENKTKRPVVILSKVNVGENVTLRPVSKHKNGRTLKRGDFTNPKFRLSKGSTKSPFMNSLNRFSLKSSDVNLPELVGTPLMSKQSSLFPPLNNQNLEVPSHIISQNSEPRKSQWGAQAHNKPTRDSTFKNQRTKFPSINKPINQTLMLI